VFFLISAAKVQKKMEDKGYIAVKEKEKRQF